MEFFLTVVPSFQAKKKKKKSVVNLNNLQLFYPQGISNVFWFLLLLIFFGWGKGGCFIYFFFYKIDIKRTFCLFAMYINILD